MNSAIEIKNQMKENMIEAIELAFDEMKDSSFEKDFVTSTGAIHLACHMIITTSYTAFIESIQESKGTKDKKAH